MKKSAAYVIDRALHWSAALLLLFMLMNLSTQLHNVDWQIKGQIEHRQDAVESHAIVGIILLVVTILRIIYPLVSKSDIPRVRPRSAAHGMFIKATHLAMYLCIGVLVVSGLLMVNNYEIPLSFLGVSFEASKGNFYQVFPNIHEFHMFAKNTIWWLIAIHFAGIMYAKK